MEKKFVFLLIWVYLSSFEFGLSQMNLLKSERGNYGSSIYSPDATERIVGGWPAKEGQYPWMVSLHLHHGSVFKHICGGVALNEGWILTAAHCLEYATKPQKYLILAGLYKLSSAKASNVQKIQISQIILHKGYNEDTFVNDIALLRTAQPVKLKTGNKNRIHFPTSDRDPRGDAKVIGWGHTRHGGENSDVLREAIVQIIPRDRCLNAYDKDLRDGADRITKTMICAGMARSFCNGDSGGPLFQQSPDRVSLLIGIVSHGSGCDTRYFPGVYTKVSSYMKWMKDIILK